MPKRNVNKNHRRNPTGRGNVQGRSHNSFLKGQNKHGSAATVRLWAPRLIAAIGVIMVLLETTTPHRLLGSSFYQDNLLPEAVVSSTFIIPGDSASSSSATSSDTRGIANQQVLAANTSGTTPITLTQVASTSKTNVDDPVPILEPEPGPVVKQEAAIITPDANANTTINTNQQRQQPIHFFGATEHINNRIDAFSASWLQRKEDFMSMNVTGILSCEDAAFLAYWGPMERVRKLQMTVDWFDLAIEHMSKWRKLLDVYREEAVYKTFLVKMETYLSGQQGSTSYHDKENHLLAVDPSFRPTIAVIAFQANTDKEFAIKARQLTLTLLAATIESLRRAGFGRVVVVGLDHEADAKLTKDTIQYLQQLLDPAVASGASNLVGHMEVAYVPGSLELAKAKWVVKNVPKGALRGLYKAFQLAEKAASDRSESEESYIKIWLGSKPDAWKYVYLTEPDCILQARPSSLPQLKARVDKGYVLTPHRLQPIPHGSDAAGCSKIHLYLPDTPAWHVLEMDPNGDSHDVCCDAWKGEGSKPGLPPLMEACGNFWYLCDFDDKRYSQSDTHKRLKPYPLMRLKGGTGIVSLSASEHGRPCTPKIGAFCGPKT